MNIKYLLFFFILSSFAYTHKLIILVSPPRSLSTVFARMMENRGDCITFNEPGITTFASLHNVHLNLQSKIEYDYTPTVSKIKAAHNTNNVFVKEMFFAADEYLLTQEFMKNPDCYFIFLVRNPHASSISHAKKLYAFNNSYELPWDIKKKVHNFMSYSSFYTCYEKALNECINTPYIIITEDLINDPQNTITKFCTYVGIPMKDSYLQWQPYDSSLSVPQAWNDNKTNETVALWHDVALASTGFTQPATYAVDANGEPTFEEIGDIALRGAYRWEYYDNLAYYNFFVKEATRN